MEISLQKSNQLKAIAILMMLFLHLFNKPFEGLFQPLLFIGNQPLSYYISLFGDACVPIFCFVSGYGLYFSYQSNKLNYKKNNQTRILKLYINYWIIVLLFAVALGFVLQKPGFPGNWIEFLLNFSALDNSYNSASWFFFTYILLVGSSVFWFRLLNKVRHNLLLIFVLILYVVGFYFRVYQPELFDNSLLNWVQRQSCLYATSLFPFFIGALALKMQWNTQIGQYFASLRYKTLVASICILILIVIHGLVPNFIVAPFLGIPFVFFFVQLQLPVILARALDFLAPHATNLWLTHMFFYMVFFPEFIYSTNYILPIFVVLIICCVLSSFVIEQINNLVLKLTLNK